MSHARALPFSALPFEESRRALLCLAIDARLAGALVRSDGQEAAILVRAFARFLVEHTGATAAVHRIPGGISREALQGEVDFEATLRAGRPVMHEGVLAREGVFFVESWGAIDAMAARMLQHAIEATPSRQLLATSAIDDEPRPDWLPLWIDLPARLPTAAGVDLVQCVLGHDRDADASAGGSRAAEQRLGDAVRAARTRCETVTLGRGWLERLQRAAIDHGVRSMRATIDATRFARAHAALRGAREIGEADVAMAESYVLLPRAKRRPDASDSPPDGSSRGSDARPPSQNAPTHEDPSDVDSGERPAADTPVDEVFEAAPATELPALPVPGAGLRRTDAQSSGRLRHGAEVHSVDRGRARAARPAASCRGRIALAETIRRAAIRNGRDPTTGRLRVSRDDLMLRERLAPAGLLTVIAVDSSGSMANQPIRAAKGVAIELLREAYRRRDAIALLAYRGNRAELLLPQTRSIARARSCLETMPTGGGTPLASALESLARLAVAERRGAKRSIRVLLFTDGRANVPLGSGTEANGARGAANLDPAVVAAELDRVARGYRKLAIDTTVVDTRAPWDARDDARRLAELLDADYRKVTNERRPRADLR